MAGGWQPTSTNNPGVRQPSAHFSCGESRTWGITIPGKDLTGYTAHWNFGIPPDPMLLGLIGTAYTPAQILIRKTTEDGSLNILLSGSDSVLRFALVETDTKSLPARQYWQQAVVFDPQGNPVMVAEGRVVLTPSFLSLETA